MYNRYMGEVSSAELAERFKDVGKRGNTLKSAAKYTSTTVTEASKALEKSEKERTSWDTERNRLQQQYDNTHANRNLDIYTRIEREKDLQQQISNAKKEFLAADSTCRINRANLAKATRDEENTKRVDADKKAAEEVLVTKWRKAWQGSMDSFNAALPALLQDYYTEQLKLNANRAENEIRSRIETFTPSGS